MEQGKWGREFWGYGCPLHQWSGKVSEEADSEGRKSVNYLEKNILEEGIASAKTLRWKHAWHS